MQGARCPSNPKQFQRERLNCFDDWNRETIPPTDVGICAIRLGG